jgi:hypothetical protein
MSQKPISEEALSELQRDTFGYFKNETNPGNGMVPDNTRKGPTPASRRSGWGWRLIRWQLSELSFRVKKPPSAS